MYLNPNPTLRALAKRTLNYTGTDFRVEPREGEIGMPSYWDEGNRSSGGCMRISNMSHDGQKYIEIALGKFFVGYNEFVVGFYWHQPPYTAGVHILRLWRFEFGWW